MPGDDALFQGRVVEPAAQAKHTRQFPLLRGSGNEFVLEGLAYRLLFHRSLFCLIGAKAARPVVWLQPSHAHRRLKATGLRRAKALFCQGRRDIFGRLV